jgi:AraC-like DNA-binding protein
MNMENVIFLQYTNRWGGYKHEVEVPHHLLLFMDEGACAYWVDGVRYRVGKGEALFIPGHSGRLGEAVNDESHAKYSVHWTGDGLFDHFPHMRGQAVLFKASALYPYLKQAYTHMRQLWVRKDAYYKTLCQSILLEVAVRLHQEQTTQQGSGKQARVVQQVRDYIMEYYREPLSVDELAHLVQRNASYLISSFKKAYGLAPLEYMHRTRITKAEELLLTTNANVEAIAVELGYCDAAYFNRMFKRMTGMTPSAYRRQF